MATPTTEQTLFMYSTTVSDVGTVRSNNQDSSFAGERLIAICDGMGGHAGGDTASTIAIRSLAHIERDDTGNDVQAVSGMMETSVIAAHDAIVGKAKRERKLAGMGTTVSAVALVGRYWVLAHIGDSRAYLLRDGKLTRMTHDHSYVQHLIDTGRITESEARNHPQRNVVMRVLGDFDIDPRPHIAVCEAHPADRWLLCSDGLSGVLEDATLKETLAAVSDQDECAQQLVAMALRAGSTDNVTAIIADATLALDAHAFDLPHQTPLVGGAAGSMLEPIADIVGGPVSSAPSLRVGTDSPAQRAATLAQEIKAQDAQRVAQPSTVREETGEITEPDTGEIPVVQKRDGRVTTDPNDPEVAKAIHHEQLQQQRLTRVRKRRGRIAIVLGVLALLLALAGGGYGAYAWSQTKYYLGDDNGVVTIYQGVPTDLFGVPLSHPVKKTDLRTASLPESWRTQLAQGIVVDSLPQAEDHAKLIKEQLRQFNEANDTGDRSGSADTSDKNTDDGKNADTSKTDTSNKDAGTGGKSSGKGGDA